VGIQWWLAPAGVDLGLRSLPPAALVTRGRLASCFILSVLLGLVFGLSSTASEVEVKARCVVVRSDMVGGATNAHASQGVSIIALSPPSGRSRLGACGNAERQGGGAPGLVGWYDGAALHTSMSMVKLRSPTTNSLRW
jgi:hypothetical protein